MENKNWENEPVPSSENKNWESEAIPSSVTKKLFDGLKCNVLQYGPANYV